jgi:uncharacterized protein YggE
MLRGALLVIVWTLAMAGSVRAQSSPPARQVTGIGTSTISARPELLRVTLELKAEGKDAKEALAKLDAEKKAAQAKLDKLGVAGDRVKFADASLGDRAMNDQQRQMQMYLNMRNSGGRGGKPAAATTRPVAVSTLLTAEVPLEAAGHEELLTTASDLQEKIKSGFKKAAKAATPEEQEVLEEMQMQQEMSTGQPQPGEPMFLFVHRLSEEEQSKAVSDAFKAAQASAARLAKAAGADLGEVRELTSTIAPGGDDADSSSAQYQYFAAMAGRTTPTDSAAEATSPRAGMVSSRVTVTAVFGLK